jgi:hypothetical protein
MITRQKASKLLYAATTVRERSSLAAAAAAHRRKILFSSGGRRLLKQEEETTLKARTMAHVGNKKRTLVTVTVTVTAAVACMIPHYVNMAMVAGYSPGTTIDRSRNRMYHNTTRRKTNTTNHRSIQSSANGTGNIPLSEVLRTLVRRLNEPVLLRATTAAAAPPSEKEPSSTIVEEQRRLAELADELVAGYASLPPLRRFGMPLNNKDYDDDSKDYSCDERSNILEFLATECCPSEADVETAVEDYRNKQEVSFGGHHSNNRYEKIRRATTPIYEGLTDFVLQQNAVTGMGFLVSLREDMLSSLRYQRQQHEAEAAEPPTTSYQQLREKVKARQERFKDLDAHLKSSFARWFAQGLLSHERITYDSTPAKIIEIIAIKEAVHPMKSLDDLKDRLGSTSKRVFALFHPCLPNQPLVFVHVALLPSGLPSSMEEIIMSSSKNNNNNHHHHPNQHEQQRPEVAAFYSISNGVKGLAGVGLGEYLLKESIKALKEELPCLQTFVTLSPIPKFRKWIKVAFLKEEQKHQQQRLRRKGESENEAPSEDEEEESSSLLSRNDREALHRCGLVSSASPFPWKEFLETLEETDFSKLIQETKTTTDRDIYAFLLQNNNGGSSNNNEPSSSTTAELESESKHKQQHVTTRTQFFVLRSVLLKLSSRYLGLEKHRGKPLEKVCGFHVGNGAELHDLHFGADLSRGGLSNSYGIMANYLYDTEKVSRNQANFESSGFVVPVGPSVRQWLEE